jgi:hypothetical protein
MEIRGRGMAELPIRETEDLGLPIWETEELETQQRVFSRLGVADSELGLSRPEVREPGMQPLETEAR